MRWASEADGQVICSGHDGMETVIDGDAVVSEGGSPRACACRYRVVSNVNVNDIVVEVNESDDASHTAEAASEMASDIFDVEDLVTGFDFVSASMVVGYTLVDLDDTVP